MYVLNAMELAHSLLLNEEAFKKIQESKRPVFVFEWLRFLDKVLGAAQKSDIKESQKKLVEQLTNQISESPGPPTRKLIARCLATLFSVGDTFDLFETINKCNDIIKNKDDSPSYLPTRLSAVACIGAMYEKLGRMVGRSYEDTIQILIKSLRNAESQGRCEIMLTLEKVVAGLGSAGSSCHKDIYKAARQAMTDRSMAVRCAAAKCMIQLVNEAHFMYTSELETVASLCFRALDGSNYDVRCVVAVLLGNLMAVAQSQKATSLTLTITICNNSFNLCFTHPHIFLTFVGIIVEIIFAVVSGLCIGLSIVHISVVSIGVTRNYSIVGVQIFSIAEELLRTASQNSRLSLQRTQAGWLLLGALMTLGPAVVRNHLPRMLLLWRNAFPRSTKELESEKARGDSFTWQVTLEGRAGALGTMQSFLQNCRELVTEDVIRRLLAPLECALIMLSHLPSVIKVYGNHLKAPSAMVRLRLYDVLSLLPPESYEATYTTLLRELVAEFTLTDNPANTTTSHLRSMCHVDDSVILGSWLQETDHKAIEDQYEPNHRRDTDNLQPNSASGSGALEHDAASLYARIQPTDPPIPGPLPLGVAVIDSSVRLYGLVFYKVAHKHRYQMLQHFNECIKQAKSSRQQAVQMNIFTAVLCALKNLADTKTSLGPDDVKKAAFNLIMGALGSSNPILRCAAGEALGRMAQVVGDSRFIAEMAQYSFDRLKSARDVVSRTGHSLALGCLHRYVGGMGSGQHLNTSVSILLALAQDFNSPVVQVWALHALALIADSGGPMFRGYVEPTLSLVLQLLLTVPPATVDVHQCLGKCLSALITSIGPELQGNMASIAVARLYCLICCAVMQDHPDSLVQAEAIACLQQLHMFAPRHVNLTTLVPHLSEILTSSHLLLRRAAVACLRQLVTREAREVSELALALPGSTFDLGNNSKDPSKSMYESGLEGTLFSMLDTEVDNKLTSDVQDTLLSLLQSLAVRNLSRWLMLLKEVLSASTDTSSTIQETIPEENYLTEKDEEDDDSALKATETDITHPSVAPRWPTRVFATDCLRKIISTCEGQDGQFDLVKAREFREQTGKSNYLVLHLSELVRMAFMAATSDSNQLRLAGLAALQDIILRFADVPEPEFPGHVILEQFQAQVGAALRPAFSPETPSDVTAAACEVCSTWIGSGVARDLNDLRRVHQLLVSSLAKLKTGKFTPLLYNESASTMEKLSVLKAWAEVYIVAVKRDKEKAGVNASLKSEELDVQDFPVESLLSLVQPELSNLSEHWMSALKDYALLSLPPEYSSQLPPEGGTFYQAETMDSSRIHYKKSWPPILYALSIWLNEAGFLSVNREFGGESNKSAKNVPLASTMPANMKPEEVNADRLYLILGICMESLCCPTSLLSEETVNTCLRALHILLDTRWPRKQIGEDMILAKELLNVMHRILLTRENVQTHLLVMEVVKQVIKASHENLDSEGRKTKENSVQTPSKDGSTESMDTIDSNYVIGEGGESGEIIKGKSVVYATLEVCLCVLVRQIPALNPTAANTGFQVPTHLTKMTDEACQLISSVVLVMAELPNLCSPAGSVTILPTILYLITSVLRETAARSAERKSPAIVTSCLQCLKTLCSSQFNKEDTVSNDWLKMLQSSLATILDFSQPGDDKPGLDESTLILTLAVFAMSSPKEVTAVPNLMNPSLEIFKEAWDSKNVDLQLKSIQTFISILQHTDRVVYTPFIHALAPKVTEYLYSITNEQPQSETELSLIFESIKMLETLLDLADDEKRVNIILVLVPILISYLLSDKILVSCSPASKLLHDHALQRLMKVGPLYPKDFRRAMSSAVDLKPRLEAAVKANQTSQKMAPNQQNMKLSAQPTKPTITLKTDFSNFTG
ncbi:HEAT repeat-containing protein 5B [Octopus bimaculoides]|uniref:HEAT repeat-containing protein 5B n=1 Tax=Octopus bimaculoides TaxID=37653 RepID=UPI0022DEF0A7|nr:HEAT repeat-containing protein 5B [Octopus bimaculoides]